MNTVHFRPLLCWATRLGITAATLVGLSVALWQRTRSGRANWQQQPESLWIESSRFQKIASGSCIELGWLPISDRSTCETAAQELGLTNLAAALTSDANRPEGCYFYENRLDLTATLWLGTNQDNKGFGALAVKGAGRREPLCIAQRTTLVTTTARTWWSGNHESLGGNIMVANASTPAPEGLLIAALGVVGGFQRISSGNCVDIDWLPILTVDTCEKAASYLSLWSDINISVTDGEDRPEGCYYLRNFQDNTATLWVATSTYNRGHGAQRSTFWAREPICMRQPTTTTQTTVITTPTAPRSTQPLAAVPIEVIGGFQIIPKGSCGGAGLHPIADSDVCNAAAKRLGLEDVGNTPTGAANRPEGCYIFRDPNGEGTTLWLSTNANNNGNGVITSGLGGLRQPICSVLNHPLVVTSATDNPGPTPTSNAVGTTGFLSFTVTTTVQRPSTSRENANAIGMRTTSTTTPPTNMWNLSIGNPQQTVPHRRAPPVSWSGCYFAGEAIANIDGVHHHAKTSQDCASSCRLYKFMAMLNANTCICRNTPLTPPEHGRVAQSLCGAICPWEDELQPQRFCGGQYTLAAYRIEAMEDAVARK